jgi:hypothetical protein
MGRHAGLEANLVPATAKPSLSLTYPTEWQSPAGQSMLKPQAAYTNFIVTNILTNPVWLRGSLSIRRDSCMVVVATQ